MICDDNKEWRKKFEAMPVTGNCDNGCGKPAVEWFGDTSCATCGDRKCIASMQREYNAIRYSEDE